MATEEEIIAELRKKFQTSDSRASLMALMIQEIRLDLMKKKQHGVSFTEAAEVFMEEAKDVQEALVYKERQAVIHSTMKQFGFTA